VESSADRQAEKSDFFWSAVTGEGRTRTERAIDKSPLAYLILLDRLNTSKSWAPSVKLVREGADPVAVAGAYGNGRRRRSVIAVMLTRAAAGHGEAIAYTVTEHAAEAGNRYSASFWLRTMRGADCIARLGDGACLDCTEPLAEKRQKNWSGPTSRTSRILYCPSCGADTTGDRDAIADVFARAAEALAITPRL
jgi:hypothetical protein